MRFTKLRLNGFKSFVDPTDLIIADGLTGVVGPNGCGKSNLLEALRWVMGENRPTAMRGSGMEDVVFAGTSKRGGKGPIYFCLLNADLPGEVEIDIGQEFPVTPQIKGAIKSLGGVLQVEEL